jgi:hypothetical protein
VLLPHPQLAVLLAQALDLALPDMDAVVSDLVNPSSCDPLSLAEQTRVC